MKKEAKMGVIQPQAKDCEQPLEAEEAGRIPHGSLWREHGPKDTSHTFALKNVRE